MAFTWFDKFSDVLLKMPPDEGKELAYAIAMYGSTGELPEVDSDTVELLLLAFKDDINNSKDARERGAKGGRPKKPEVSETQKPEVSENTKPNTNQTNTNQTNIEREGKQSGKRFAPPTEDEAEKCATEYMHSKGSTVTFDKSRFVNFYAARGWKGVSNWESLVKAWVDTSIEEECGRAEEAGKPRGKPRKCPNCGANVSKDTGTGKWVCDVCFEELA